MNKLIATAALLLTLTGCAVYPPTSVAVGVYVPNVIVGVTYGNPGYHRHYYGSPYDSGPFGYSREVQERGSYYSPPVGNCGHKHHR
jgi:hypothetical protein